MSRTAHPFRRLTSRLAVGRALPFVLLAALVAAPGAADVYQYDHVPGSAQAIPFALIDNVCQNGTSALNVQFTVPETFNALSAAVGLNISHNRRRDIRAYLVPPGGSPLLLFAHATSGTRIANYDIFLTHVTDTGQDDVGLLNDGNDDPVAEPYYNRIVNGISALNFGGSGRAANGTWTLRVCDRNLGTNGSLNRARLVLTSSQNSQSAAVCTSRASYAWSSNGDNTTFNSAPVGGLTLEAPASQRIVFGGLGTGAGIGNSFTTQSSSYVGVTSWYSLYMRPEAVPGNQPPETIGEHVTFTFSLPVHDLELGLLDVDWGNNDFEDVIRLEGRRGDAFVPFARWAQTGSPSFEFAGDLVEGDTANPDTSTDGRANFRFNGALDDFTVLYYTGNEVNGSESNDQRIGLSDFSFCAFDFGDAPDSYGTSLAADGARHVLGERRIWLGANRPDGESDGAPAVFGLNATGDDDARIGAVVDEDGVDLFPPCPQSGTYAVSVTASNLTSNLAYLVGYIDWDRDGRFTETGDRSATVPVPAGTTSGTFPVTWESVPVDCGGTEPTYARFRISSNQSAVLSPTGMAPDGEVEDYRIGAGTLPVTVARVESERVGREVVVRWTTASETSNAGFRLWSAEGEEAGELLGSVPSRKSDSFAPQAYEARLPAGKAEAFLIEDVSVLGRSRVHGPFAVGLAYGVEIEPQPNPWPALREELARNVAMESGPVAPSFSLNRYPPARIEVRAAGIQRIAYEDLAAAGVDLVGVPASRLALLDRGEAIARYVHAPDGLFGPGAWIEFYLEPELTLASPLDVVVLTVDAARALEPAPLAAPGGAAPAVLPAELEVASERLYSFSSPTADPWFEAQVLAWGRAARYEREFDLPGLADGEATLRVRGWGYGTFGESEPDHHVQVELNGSVVGEARFGGITPFEIEVDATGLLAETGNRVTVVVPGDVPYPFDNIAYDGLSVVYPRWSSAVDERFAGDARQVQWLAIDGFAPGSMVSVWSRVGEQWYRTELPAPLGEVQVTGGGFVAAASADGLARPRAQARVPVARRAAQGDYLIVTHPALASAVAPLATLRRGQGLETTVVSVEEIYAAYSDHAPSAAAIGEFVRASVANGVRYVLLAGSDTVDPYDHLGFGSFSFVPTAYVDLGPVVRFSPTDEPYVDVDGDGVGDAAIGRLPARSVGELEAMVAKILAWESSPRMGTALFASGASDVETQSLGALSLGFAARLPGWSTAQAAVDQIGTPAARAAVLAALQNGTQVVNYVGHSAAEMWDWDPLLLWWDVDGLTSVQVPSLVTAWGCWNSYFVDPETESLAAHLLRAPGAGATAAIGATTLTSEASHQALGELFFAQVAAGNTRIGDAFRLAKQQLAVSGGAADAIVGMTLLGDPALRLPAVRNVRF